MTEVNPAASSGAAANTSAASSTSATTTEGIGAEFNTFLQLLTAQIQNQDPLAPLDSTQFVEQLATFSSLEQQVQTNSSLEGISAMLSDLHAIIASDWLGQEVAVPSTHVAYEGEPIEFEVNPGLTYDEAVLTVRDTQGEVVWQETLAAEQERYTWDGSMLDTNEQAPNGVYEFQLDLYRDGKLVTNADAEIISKVTTLANENGQMKIGTDNHLTTDVTAARKVNSD